MNNGKRLENSPANNMIDTAILRSLTKKKLKLANHSELKVTHISTSFLLKIAISQYICDIVICECSVEIPFREFG